MDASSLRIQQLEANNFTDAELHDLCRALGTKVHAMERSVERARSKGLQELTRNLEKGLDRWIRLLNKTRELNHGGADDTMD